MATKLVRIGLLLVLGLAAIIAICFALFWAASTPFTYDAPSRTQWQPEGTRSLAYLASGSDAAGGDVLGNPASYFRALHVDTINSDEIAGVVAPVFEAGWHTEAHTFNTEGPTFDGAGNLYFSPLFSGDEDVVLISLNAEDGSRRWAVPGTPGGAGAPLVLDDPDNPGEQIIYVSAYDRAFAIKPNADANADKIIQTDEMIWSVPTGLSAEGVDRAPHIFGLNYDPTTDTVIALAKDNHIIVLDRKTGRSLLREPYSIPDIAPSPSREIETPDRIMARVEKAATPLFGDTPFSALIGPLLGNATLIANYFSVDPHSGRIWVAATAPDAEDGSADGISELGALYSLRLSPGEDDLLTVEMLNHVSFEGGSASTPALSADGTRVYVGDNFGKLLAIDSTDASVVWELDVGEQIFGSISVASDNAELYLPAATSIIKVVDEGDSARLVWRGDLDMYPELGFNKNTRSLTATITANGLAFMASSELQLGPGLMLSLGTGLMDRETGEVRYFVEGREDSVSVTSIGPDGSIYIGHSPIKRIFASALFGEMLPPLTGGVQKYAAVRFDLLMRDAIHAAFGRAQNAAAIGKDWPKKLKDLEAKHILVLIDQSKRASSEAIREGTMTTGQWEAIEAELDIALEALSNLDFDKSMTALSTANSLL